MYLSPIILLKIFIIIKDFNLFLYLYSSNHEIRFSLLILHFYKY